MFLGPISHKTRLYGENSQFTFEEVGLLKSKARVTLSETFEEVGLFKSRARATFSQSFEEVGLLKCTNEDLRNL